MVIDCITEKLLNDGHTLKLVAYHNCPSAGKRTYQLNLELGYGSVVQFPNTTKVTEAQVREMYDSIQSGSDLEEMMGLKFLNGDKQ